LFNFGALAQSKWAISTRGWYTLIRGKFSRIGVKVSDLQKKCKNNLNAEDAEGAEKGREKEREFNDIKVLEL